MRVAPALLALALLSATADHARAQAAPPQGAGPDCASGVAQPGTAPMPGEGTAPGNAGNTGWSGGTGGSQIGTNTSGAVPGSPTWQPPTARGLDLKGAPEPTAATATAGTDTAATSC